jgi:hypothetical protein
MKKEMYDKLAVLGEELPMLLSELDPHHIFVEKSIFVKNPDTARKLSFIVGGIMLVATQYDYPLTLVEPATWKSFTQYRNMTRKMVASAKEKLGDREGKKFLDRMRKVQTSRVLQYCYPKWALDWDDHDVVDSCGIALYGVNQMSIEIHLEAPMVELVTQEELDILGV